MLSESTENLVNVLCCSKIKVLNFHKSFYAKRLKGTDPINEEKIKPQMKCYYAFSQNFPS